MKVRIKKISFLPITPYGGLIDYLKLPDYVILEAELLESQEIEGDKCCPQCANYPKNDFQLVRHRECMFCTCHSKAPKSAYEEQNEWIDRTNKAIRNKGYKILDEFLTRKEIEVPSKITVTDVPAKLVEDQLIRKINEVIDYLDLTKGK